MDEWDRIDGIERKVALWSALADEHEQAGRRVQAAMLRQYVVAMQRTQEQVMHAAVAAGRL